MSDQTGVPVQYGRHESPEPGTLCAVCGTTPQVPHLDHCHTHGWVRGWTCASCNSLLGVVDAGKSPRVKHGRPLLEALIRHVACCPECEPVDADSLIPPPVLLVVPKETAARARDAWIDAVEATRTLPTKTAFYDAVVRVGLEHLDEAVALLIEDKQRGEFGC